LPRPGPAPKFSDAEVIALSIYRKLSWLIVKIISLLFFVNIVLARLNTWLKRSRYNRRRKQRHGLTERLRLKLANEMAEGETVFVIDSMPILLTKLQKINLN
jgi:hypothetical protein